MACKPFHNLIRDFLRSAFRGATIVSLFAIASGADANAQSVVQVPYGSTYIGVPASTWNGTDGQACTSTNPFYLDSHGDGCSATQATLNYPLGIAMDRYNNLYVAEYGSDLVRVVYQGGTALAAALVAANPKYAFTPTPGSVYPIGGSTAALSSVSGVYYCVGKAGATALDKAGDGCPAQDAYIQLRMVAVDHDGNMFLGGIYPYNGIRIVYVGGTAAAKLITTYNPAVTAPQIGYVYNLSASGDFSSIRDLYVDDNENIYAADSGAQAAAPAGLQAATTGNQIKKFTGTGWSTFLLGSASATPTGVNGDGGPVASASTNGVLGVSVDHSGNVYFCEGLGRIRVVYAGGSTPPLYVQGANSVVVANPVPGNVYSVAGGGTLRTSSSLASALNVSVGSSNSLSSFALDNSGNLIFTDSQSSGYVYGYTWRVDARTGVAVIIGGNGTSLTAASASTHPGPGVPCNGTSGGPLMTDAFDDGCPATEILPYTPRSRMVFDTAGNYYQVETRIASQPDGIVRKYTFANQLGSVAVGSSVTTSLAFTPTTATSVTPAESLVLTGDTTTEFTDAGGALCSTSGTASVQTCTYNVNFAPTLAGPRLGALTLSTSGADLISVPLGGNGIGAELTFDPGTRALIGSGLTPSGIGLDQGGNAYIADATTGNLYKSSLGGAPSVVSTGYKNAAQIAVDNSGNVFVADTGNNRIAVAVNNGISSAELNSINALTLSAPAGVAADLAGNLYIADTGNNRVLMLAPLGGVTVEPFTGLSAPHGLAVDAAGDIFVADTGNARVVELSGPIPGTTQAQSIVTITPSLTVPVSVSLDPAGDLYIADSSNQNVVVLPAGSTSATTLYGDTTLLTGVAVDSAGNVFLSASSLGGLIELTRANIAYTFPDTNVGISTTQLLTLNSIGNTPLVLGSSLGAGTDTTDFSTGTASSNSCSTTESINPGTSCAVLATFMPHSKAALSSTVTFASNSVGSSVARLFGTGVQKTATTTTLSYTTPTGGQPIVGQAFTITAKVSSTTATGTATFTIDDMPFPAATVTAGTASLNNVLLAAGSHTIVVAYSGDATYTASAASLSVTSVAPAVTTTTFITNPAPPGNGVAFTVNATISSTASQGPINGTVTFTVNGYTPLQTATTVTVNGGASTSFTLPTGKYTITIAYGGSPYYLANTVTLPVQVVPDGTSSVKLIMTAPSAPPISLGQTVSFQATTTTGNSTSTPTGTITFQVDANVATAVTVSYASVTSASFNGLSAGNHTITAMYSGDNNYAPGVGTLAITVVRATPATALTITPNISASGNSFTITANVTSSFTAPTGTVTLSVAGNTYGPTALVNGSATFLTATNALSSYLFSASYSGDSNFVPETFTSTPAPTFVSAVQTSSLTIPQYGVALDYVTLNSFFGYTGTVQIVCSGLPQNSNCRTSPSIDSVSADAVTTVQLQFFTNLAPNSYARLDRGPLGQRSRPLTTITLSLLLGIPLAVYRRRLKIKLSGLILALISIAGAVSLSGCVSDTHSTTPYSTPTGTYPITITTTDGTTTQKLSVSLTVLTGIPNP